MLLESSDKNQARLTFLLVLTIFLLSPDNKVLGSKAAIQLIVQQRTSYKIQL